MAINRAMPSYKLYENTARFSAVPNSSEFCIFISHKSEDLDAAKNIGDYIMNHGKIDIYLDCYDGGLYNAIKNGNDKLIVDCIEKGLKKSTHLLCLISDKTKVSWWVPFEVGYIKNAKKNIASLKLKNVDDIPSFLKVEQVLMGINSLNGYLEGLNQRILNESHNLISYTASKHPTDSYLDWNG